MILNVGDLKNILESLDPTKDIEIEIIEYDWKGNYKTVKKIESIIENEDAYVIKTR